MAPDDVLVGPAHRLLECSVRSDARIVGVAIADRAVWREDDHDARHRLEYGRLDVALPLQLELATTSLGDVGATGDDGDDCAVLVVNRRCAPVHDTLFAARVHECVFVLRRREVGRERFEALDHVIALGFVDEDVPVVLPDDLVVGGEAGGLGRRDVDVLESSFDVDGREEARQRVRDRARVLDLEAQLGLKAVAAQRQPCCRGHAVEQFRVRVERGVVRDRGDP